MRNDLTYSLLPGQGACLDMQAKHKAFIGGIGSGKTFFGALWAMMQSQGKGDGMVLSPTYRMLEDVTQKEFFGFLERHGATYHHDRSRGQVITPQGTIFLRSAENPDRLRGPNLTWAWGDEAALWREETFKVLLGRLRMNNAHSLYTTTPAGFNWLWKYFVDEPGDRFRYVQGSSRENPHLDAEFVNDLEDAYSTEFAAQEIEGRFVAFEGMIYSEFNRHVHVQDFDVPDGWPRYRAIDYGYTNPLVCLWGATDEDGRLYIYNEHYQRKQLIAQHAATINGYETSEYAWTVADHDAQDNAEMGSHGISPTSAKKDVTIGIQRVKARLEVQKDKRPRMYIHPRCVNLIKEIDLYRWAPMAKTGGNAKEAPVKELDHAMDALRYMVMELDNGSFVFI